MNLVDAQLEWTGGDSRLIVLGDLVDRGKDSRAALDLMLKLQASAARAGGTAELLLGNHEVMNLTSDLHYVAVDDFADYRAEESPAERAEAWQRFRDRAAWSGRAETQLAAGVRATLSARLLRPKRAALPVGTSTARR